MANLDRQSEIPLLPKIHKTFDTYKKAEIDVRLVGSWGKAAAFKTPLPETKGDYGGLRDIDIVSLAPDSTKALRIIV